MEMRSSRLDKLAIKLNAYLDKLEQKGILGKIAKRIILLILIIVGSFIGGLLLFVLPMYVVIMIQELEGVYATMFAIGVTPVQSFLARMYERNRSFWALLFSVVLMIAALFKTLARFGSAAPVIGMYPVLLLVILGVISWDPSASRIYRIAYLVVSILFNFVIVLANIYLYMTGL